VGEIQLPVSKSESNRALMLEAYSGRKIQIGAISEARDTQVLQQALAQSGYVVDVGDAGTAFRFLTVYFALKGQSKVLTGSSRMKERPIGPLVEALRILGAQIDYEDKEGFPPLVFGSFHDCSDVEVEIDVQTSSQFASALALAGPSLPNGIAMKLKGDQNSSSYLNMTLDMMQRMGIKMQVGKDRIQIPAQSYPDFLLEPETDWSSAGYWLAMAALAPAKVHLVLKGLKPQSLQGDSRAIEILKGWGLESRFLNDGLEVIRTKKIVPENPFYLDAKDMPDFAQTILVVCALTGVEAYLTGLKTLAFKETDRLWAMATEFKKVGIHLDFNNESGTCHLSGNQVWEPGRFPVEVHQDHRIAMSFALAACKFPVEIKNPEVVVKSYPGFWSELEKVGFGIKRVPCSAKDIF
jgi:3-phosphoshikimate 1-carboxyvinyltransferase